MNPVEHRTTNFMGHYIFKEVAQQLERSKLLIIDHINFEQSLQVASVLKDLIQSNPSCEDMRIASLGRITDLGSNVVSPQTAVEYRNSDRRVILFLPTEQSGSIGSLAGFDQQSYAQMMDRATVELEKDLTQRGLKAISPDNRRNIIKLSSQSSLLDFLLVVKESEDLKSTFGRELWRISLVPDLSDHAHSPENLSRNIAASIAIAAKSQPLSSWDERLDSILLEDGSQRADIKKSLKDLTYGFSFWAKGLLNSESPELTFDKWRFQNIASTSLQGIAIDSFRTKDGNATARSKLKYQEQTNELHYSGRLVVDWTSEPKSFEGEVYWEVSLLRIDDDGSDPFSVSKKLPKRSRSFKLEDAAIDQEHFGRYKVRVRACDKRGLPLSNGTGDIEAYSDDFIVEELAETSIASDPAAANANSIYEAQLRFLLDRRNKLTDVQFGSAVLSTDLQRLDILIGQGFVGRIRTSVLARQIQKMSIRSGVNGSFFEGFVPAGTSQADESFFTQREFGLPDYLGEARKAFFDLIMLQPSERSFVESCDWDENVRSAGLIYLEAFERALKEETNVELKEHLFKLDQIDVEVETSNGSAFATIVLPTHPLRIAWFMGYTAFLANLKESLSTLAAEHRASAVEIGLIESISARNVPFSLKNETLGERVVYSEELVYGYGLYLATSELDIAMTTDTILRIFGVTGKFRLSNPAGAKFSEHVERYYKKVNFTPGLRVMAINPGDGNLIRPAIAKLHEDMASESRSLTRVEIYGFDKGLRTNVPLKGVFELQNNYYEEGLSKRERLYAPNFSVVSRNLEELHWSNLNANIALVQNITTSTVATAEIQNSRPPLINGLATYIYTLVKADGDDVSYFSTPSVNLTKSEGLSFDIGYLHYLHQLSLINGVPDKQMVSAVKVGLSKDSLQVISDIHRKSDWVVTVDKFLGVSLYDEGLSRSSGEFHVLDYSPDFVDGFADRITLTTTRSDEISQVLLRAMESLGFLNYGVNAMDVLRDLAGISGRLTMRLLNSNSLATEAIGLAASVRHLKAMGKIRNAIIIPIDSHSEMFSVNASEEDFTKERCDVLIVRFLDSGYSVDLMEVKTRTGIVTRDLDVQIKNQIDKTEVLLNRLLFATSSSRLDSDLQWARWVSLLHFYLDRSVNLGHVEVNLRDKLHRRIDVIASEKLAPEITKSGFIVALDASDEGSSRSVGGVQIEVLTDARLRADGWETAKHFSQEVGVDVDPIRILSDEFQKPANDNFAQGQSKEQSLRSEMYGSKSIRHPLVSDELMNTQQQGDPAPSANPAVGQVGEPKDNFVRVELGLSTGSQPVEWKISTAGSPHGVIVGIPGQGKSVTTKRIISEFNKGGLPSLIFDFHGEMGQSLNLGFRHIDVAADGLPFSPFEIDGNDSISVKTASAEIAEILESAAGLGEIQRTNVSNALRSAFEMNGWGNGSDGSRLPTIADFVGELEKIEAQMRGKNARQRLDSFTDYELFRDDVKEEFNLLSGQGVVFDVSRYRIEAVKLMAGSFILRKIYNEMFLWGKSDNLRLALVLDEAHRLAKNPTIPRLMKEGRKYGISVLLVSQSLDDFAQPVPENAGLKIAFRTNYPISRKVANILRSRGSDDLSEEIENLPVGMAFVATPDMYAPVKTQMHEN